MTRSVLGLFTKFWQPGQVKTRLAADTSPRFACAVHRLFVETTCQRFRQTAGCRYVVHSPSQIGDQMRQELGQPDWQFCPQSTGDLGARMGNFVQPHIQSGGTVVLIGSDSPTLPTSLIDEAISSLTDHDVAIIPADDGGYCAIGLNTWIPEIFQDMPWSTPDVCNITLQRLEAAGHRACLLPAWFDVDDRMDLDRLREELNGASGELATLATKLRQLMFAHEA